ncbi:MAG: RsmD family RNA methyltransferase [Candidatus Heimdallarchaeota archaeon]
MILLNRYFFLLSGEHSELPKAEIEAILESEKITTGKKEYLDQVLLIETTSEGLKHIAGRAAMVHGGGLHLLTIRLDRHDWKDKLKTAINAINLPLRVGSSFAVRCRRIKLSCSHIKIPTLEMMIGKYLKQQDIAICVDLERPDQIVYGILTELSLVLGLKLFSIKRGAFDTRRAHFRKFVHPSAINPRLARTMVNLSRASPQKRFLDPFTGSGGMLIEAGMIGCKPLGIEIDPKMIRGAQTNLHYFRITDYELIVGDARTPPVIEVDAIATDPPYGASSSTKGVAVSELIQDVLLATREILTPGGFICIATPNTINLEQQGKNANLQLFSMFLQFVHRSLTRKIGVFKR